MDRKSAITSKLAALLRQMGVGIALTILIVGGTALYVELFGPLYGVWGWLELVLGLLILTASALAGIVMFFRQPNPYSRSHPLYDLRDVTPDRDLDSGGAGWIIQAVPLAAAAIVIIFVLLLV